MTRHQLQIFVLAIMTASAAAVAQNSPVAPPASAPATASTDSQSALKLAPGSVIPVVLSHTVDAKKAKSGDSVQAKVADDLKANNGQVLVPKDTVIAGHVTAAQPHSKGTTSELAVVFDHAVLKGGNSAAWPMTVQAIIGNNQNNALNSEPDSSGGAPSGPMSSTSGGMAGGRAPGGSSSMPGANSAPDVGSQASAPSARPQITAATQGVIGIPDLKLESSPQGAVITSEKSNVKLESGTFLLLRVIQQ